MRLWSIAILSIMGLAACSNFTPQPKTAQYDPVSGKIVPPHPCPDWSQSQTHNYLNETHSNYGCAVNTNSAIQLAYPEDLIQGHGDTGPDTGISTHVIEDYRAGKIPAPLVPVEASGTSSQ